MKRLLPVFLAFAVFACATTPTPMPAPAPAPAAAVAATPAPVGASTAAPCDPGLSLLNATLWVQTSAEYRAAATQVFATASRGLDAALGNLFAQGALEETQNDPTQPPAVILDLDETVLDNSAFEARAIRAHKTYDSKLWKQWTAEGAALAIPGAREFLDYAMKRGVTPFYITNRDADEEPGTRRNLEQLGFPLDPKIDTLLMQGNLGFNTSDKTHRRKHVASTHRILLVIGDDLNDFAPASGKTLEERNKIVDSVRNWWGEVFFIVPNPMYGSWERAVAGSGSPCEQMQRKLDTLRDE
ncbi:MAG TPA: HAD family acid phosphatase [Thermoanaerobaculia bacterium]|nr:HAD family acid phosphatase [Thermoanaerobaculia bacterium]